MIGQSEDWLPPDLPVQDLDGLVKTLAGFCNECTLPRASIIGALETVKHTFLQTWLRETEESEE